VHLDAPATVNDKPEFGRSFPASTAGRRNVEVPMPRRTVTVAIAALLALGAAACTNDDGFESVTPTTSATSAGTLPEAAVQTTAEELVREYYANLTCEGKDAEAYAQLLDDSFVSVTATGVKDRAAVLKLLETNCFENPTVSDIRAHQTPGVLVVPYVGKVDSNGVSQPASQRVNVFVNDSGTWRGVLFASAAPIASDVAASTTTAPGAAAPSTTAPSTEAPSSTTPSSSAPTTAAASAEAERTGVELVQQYFANLTCDGKDAQAYAALLDDSFVSITASGVKDKAEVLELLDNVCYSKATTDDIRVSETPGVLVVTYRGRVDVDGKEASETQRVNVFVDDNGTWKGVMYADTGTPA
jgi:hypothetical protein